MAAVSPMPISASVGEREFICESKTMGFAASANDGARALARPCSAFPARQHDTTARSRAAGRFSGVLGSAARAAQRAQARAARRNSEIRRAPEPCNAVRSADRNGQWLLVSSRPPCVEQLQRTTGRECEAKPRAASSRLLGVNRMPAPSVHRGARRSLTDTSGGAAQARAARREDATMPALQRAHRR